MDVLGFLSYEMVRALCERGLAVKRDYESARLARGQDSKPEPDVHSSPSKRKRRANPLDGLDDDYDGSEAYKRSKPIGPFSGPSTPAGALASSSCLTPSRTSFLEDPFGISEVGAGAQPAEEPVKEAAVEPAVIEPVRSPLRVADVEDAYSMMQMRRVKTKTSALRNFTGAFVRNKVSLI